MSEFLARTILKSGELQAKLYESSRNIGLLHDQLTQIMEQSESRCLTGDALAYHLGCINNMMVKVIKAHNNCCLSMQAAIDGFEKELTDVATD